MHELLEGLPVITVLLCIPLSSADWTDDLEGGPSGRDPTELLRGGSKGHSPVDPGR